jgi:hypothetical protein
MTPLHMDDARSDAYPAAAAACSQLVWPLPPPLPPPLLPPAAAELDALRRSASGGGGGGGGGGGKGEGGGGGGCWDDGSNDGSGWAREGESCIVCLDRCVRCDILHLTVVKQWSNSGQKWSKVVNSGQKWSNSGQKWSKVVE